MSCDHTSKALRGRIASSRRHHDCRTNHRPPSRLLAVAVKSATISTRAEDVRSTDFIVSDMDIIPGPGVTTAAEPSVFARLGLSRDSHRVAPNDTITKENIRPDSVWNRLQQNLHADDGEMSLSIL